MAGEAELNKNAPMLSIEILVEYDFKNFIHEQFLLYVPTHCQYK